MNCKDCTTFKELDAELMDQMNRFKIVNELLQEGLAEEMRKGREKDALAMHQAKLASIGQLAAGVAHEINNPMGFITSNLNAFRHSIRSLQTYMNAVEDLVAANLSEEMLAQLQKVRKTYHVDYILEDLQPMLDESIEGADRVRRIVLDLKDFAKPGIIGQQMADLNQLINCTINVLGSELKHAAQFTTELAELPPLLCCPQQINQVIANLLTNAAHAVEQHGAVSIQTFLKDQHVILVVADTGKGIPPELQSRIFDPFFTTKEVGKGAGLGLSVCYDIIKKHGGEIIVESEVERGTSMTVKLPVTSDVPGN